MVSQTPIGFGAKALAGAPVAEWQNGVDMCSRFGLTTQATVALSSAEAEHYALTEGAAQALGMMALLADLGVEVQAAVHTDASAAIGIARRSGPGKLRHLNVRYLWLRIRLQRATCRYTRCTGLSTPRTW